MARTKQTKRGKKSDDKPRFAPKRNRGKKDNVWDPSKARNTYVEAVRESEAFEAYYKAQNIIPSEEWDVFMQTMKDNLPTAFRVTGSKAEAKSLLSIVESQFFKDLVTAETGDETNEAVKPICLPWYPNRLAWQLQLTRKDIRSSETYLKLHNFLISETESGCISRQETVSMIPPILMDVKPHHKVLDMCAAPGSKTAQLIEMLHAEDSETGKLPEGLVVANDVDNNRCYMLVHQAKRLSSPCITIINHDAGALPNMFTTNPDGSKSVLKFDRILCDVPCSGDGTLRKNPDIWMKWNAANGNNMHGIQYRVARRGLEMLAVGGRLVYSTCSLNPVEDEAVVSRLIKDAEGAVQLVDITASVPGLVHSKGVTKWVVCARDKKIYDKYEDVPQQFHTQIRPSLFPLPEGEINQQHLERCIRILPHHQNTGGFFVAVLEKTKSLPWESQKSSTEGVSADNGGTAKGEEETKEEKPQRSKSPQRKRRRIQGYKEDPFVFFSEEEELWPKLRDFYDIRPELSPTCFLTRCAVGKKKNIYFTSPAVRDLVVNNQDHIKVINTGLKTFARCDNKEMECPFRLAQEGLKSIVSLLGPKRKVKVTKDDFILLLTNDDPRFPPEISKFSEPVQERLNGMEPQGSLVVEFDESWSVVGWKGARSLRAYVSVADCVHMLRLLGVDVSKYEKNKFKGKAARDEKDQEDGNGEVKVEPEDGDMEPKEEPEDGDIEPKEEPEDEEESMEDEPISENLEDHELAPVKTEKPEI